MAQLTITDSNWNLSLNNNENNVILMTAGTYVDKNIKISLTGSSTDFQSYIAELQEKVNKNSTDIETNNIAVETISKQYNLISQHLDNIDKRNEEIEIAFSKQTPWIGSKEEYESLEDKDPDKLYFIYEE